MDSILRVDAERAMPRPKNKIRICRARGCDCESRFGRPAPEAVGEPSPVRPQPLPVTAEPQTEAAAATEAKPAPEAVEQAVLPDPQLTERTKLFAITSQITQESPEILWTLCAKDIMRTHVVWCQSDESVEQVHTKMNQNDVGCILRVRD
jgi:CBS domain-containing protein